MRPTAKEILTSRNLQLRNCSPFSKTLFRQQAANTTHPQSPTPPESTAKMGRLHSNGKGISASAIPYSRNPPSWLKTTPDQVVEQICKLAKKGATPSQIGVVLRDSHGIAQVKVVTGTFLSSVPYPQMGF